MSHSTLFTPLQLLMLVNSYLHLLKLLLQTRERHKGKPTQTDDGSGVFLQEHTWQPRWPCVRIHGWDIPSEGSGRNQRENTQPELAEQGSSHHLHGTAYGLAQGTKRNRSVRKTHNISFALGHDSNFVATLSSFGVQAVHLTDLFLSFLVH